MEAMVGVGVGCIVDADRTAEGLQVVKDLPGEVRSKRRVTK